MFTKVLICSRNPTLKNLKNYTLDFERGLSKWTVVKEAQVTRIQSSMARKLKQLSALLSIILNKVIANCHLFKSVPVRVPNGRTLMPRPPILTLQFAEGCILNYLTRLHA